MMIGGPRPRLICLVCLEGGRRQTPWSMRMGRSGELSLVVFGWHVLASGGVWPLHQKDTGGSCDWVGGEYALTAAP